MSSPTLPTTTDVERGTFKGDNDVSLNREQEDSTSSVEKTPQGPTSNGDSGKRCPVLLLICVAWAATAIAWAVYAIQQSEHSDKEKATLEESLQVWQALATGQPLLLNATTESAAQYQSWSGRNDVLTSNTSPFTQIERLPQGEQFTDAVPAVALTDDGQYLLAYNRFPNINSNNASMIMPRVYQWKRLDPDNTQTGTWVALPALPNVLGGAGQINGPIDAQIIGGTVPRSDRVNATMELPVTVAVADPMNNQVWVVEYSSSPQVVPSWTLVGNGPVRDTLSLPDDARTYHFAEHIGLGRIRKFHPVLPGAEQPVLGWIRLAVKVRQCRDAAGNLTVYHGIRFLEFNGTHWRRDAGGDVCDNVPGDALALSSDGTTVAAGNRNGRGSIRTWGWDDSLDDFGKVWSKGQYEITNPYYYHGSTTTSGENTSPQNLGRALDLSSDGKTLAAGMFWQDANNRPQSAVKVFRYIDSVWYPDGNAMIVPRADRMFSVDLSADGNTLTTSDHRDWPAMITLFRRYPSDTAVLSSSSLSTTTMTTWRRLAGIPLIHPLVDNRDGVADLHHVALNGNATVVAVAAMRYSPTEGINYQPIHVFRTA